MIVGVNAQLVGHGVIKSPADIIMAAYIVYPAAILFNSKALLH